MPTASTLNTPLCPRPLTQHSSTNTHNHIRTHFHTYPQMDANKRTHTPQLNGCQDKNNVANDLERGKQRYSALCAFCEPWWKKHVTRDDVQITWAVLLSRGGHEGGHTLASGRDHDAEQISAPNHEIIKQTAFSCTDLDECGCDVWVGDPAGDDQRLLLLHVQHIWAHTRMLHKWLLAVWNPNTAGQEQIRYQQ